MRKSRWIILIIFAAFPCMIKAQEKMVGFRIVQEDSVYTPETPSTVIHLKKKSFKIQVLLQNLKGVYSFASTRGYMDSLPDDHPVPGFDSMEDHLVVEERDNKEKELQVVDDGWCYWSCNPPAVTGFNKKYVLLDSGRVVGIKSVKQLYFASSHRSIKLKDVTMPIYIFFVAVDLTGPNGRPSHELMRRKVKIEWVEDD